MSAKVIDASGSTWETDEETSRRLDHIGRYSNDYTVTFIRRERGMSWFRVQSPLGGGEDYSIGVPSEGADVDTLAALVAAA